MSDTVTMRVLDADQADFDEKLSALLAWDSVSDAAVADVVASVLADVKARGDGAVLDYTARFDQLMVAGMATLTVPAERLQAALESITSEQRGALEAAAQRVRQYHEHQKQDSW